MPFANEVKSIVFTLSRDSAAALDGFTRAFFQECWDIVAKAVEMVVKPFFCQKELPRFVTHTNLIIIPKKEFPATYTDLRPISLSGFTYKIISRVLHERLVLVLPQIISLN